ncbi:MAG: hypothetical protein ACOCW2_00200 [Chitinivibrionales bacterium]
MSDEKPVSLKLFEKPFTCHVCQNDRFIKKSAQMSFAGGSFLGRSQESLTVLICNKCGYVHSFAPRLGEFGRNA